MSSDFLFPLTPDLQLIKNEGVTVQNIIQLFYTRALEHIYFPSMGVGMERYVFENSVDLFNAIQQPIIEQIKRYVPEFQDASIEVTQESVTSIKIITTGRVPLYGKDIVSFSQLIQGV